NSLYQLGTQRGDRELLVLIDDSVTRLTAGGSRVAFVTFPPPTTSLDLGVPSPRAIFTAVQLNRLLRQYSAAHPANTFVVDVARMVCPSGPPCPTTVDGVVL